MWTLEFEEDNKNTALKLEGGKYFFSFWEQMISEEFLGGKGEALYK